jgi:hypothetical protein
VADGLPGFHHAPAHLAAYDVPDAKTCGRCEPRTGAKRVFRRIGLDNKQPPGR